MKGRRREGKRKKGRARTDLAQLATVITHRDPPPYLGDRLTSLRLT